MQIQPPATLVLGAPGSGKTDVTATYTEAGVEVFTIITEPGGVDSLLDSYQRRKLPTDKLHWTTVIPSAAGWSALEDTIKIIGTTSYEDITKIKSGIGKNDTKEVGMRLLRSFSQFKCERTGQNYGDITTWDDSRALVLDSLSGVSLIAMALAIGYKPAAHQGEWGVAMNFVEQLLLKITSDRKCFFTLTAHIEREMEDISGVTRVMASTLGRKLAPKIPRFFSEVVWAKRILEGNPPQPKFTWSTADNTADLKNRALAVSTALPPSYVPIVEAYRRRKAQAGATPQAPAPAPQQPTAVLPNAPMRPTVAPTAPSGNNPSRQ